MLRIVYRCGNMEGENEHFLLFFFVLLPKLVGSILSELLFFHHGLKGFCVFLLIYTFYSLPLSNNFYCLEIKPNICSVFKLYLHDFGFYFSVSCLCFYSLCKHFIMIQHNFISYSESFFRPSGCRGCHSESHHLTADNNTNQNVGLA